MVSVEYITVDDRIKKVKTELPNIQKQIRYPDEHITLVQKESEAQQYLEKLLLVEERITN